MSRKDHGDLVRVGVLDQDVLAQYAFKHLLEESQEIRVVATWKDIFAVSDAQLAEMDILLVAVETVLAAGVDLADYLSVLIEKVAVLAVSARKDPGFVVTCVKVGVAGMVWKGADPASILQAVRDSLAGEQPIVPPVEDNSVSYALKHDIDGYFELTDREHEVLGLIASGMSNKEIAATLDLSVRTVKAHVSHILRKLRVADRTQAALMAVHIGKSARVEWYQSSTGTRHKYSS